MYQVSLHENMHICTTSAHHPQVCGGVTHYAAGCVQYTPVSRREHEGIILLRCSPGSSLSRQTILISTRRMHHHVLAEIVTTKYWALEVGL